MAIDIEHLKSIAYFSTLSQAELEAIAEFIFEKRAQRGDIILIEGETNETIYFVVSGAVKAFKTSPEGKEQILRIIRPGQSFGDISALDDGDNLASAEAMGTTLLYGIRNSDIRTLLGKYNTILHNVIKILGQRVRSLVLLVEDLSFKHVIGRVAKLLLEYADSNAENKPKLTQQEMAAMIGSAREVVGRSLKALEETNAIKIDRHRIVIQNKETLEALAW